LDLPDPLAPTVEGREGGEGEDGREERAGTRAESGKSPLPLHKRTDHVDARREDLGHGLVLVGLESVDDDLRGCETGSVVV